MAQKLKTKNKPEMETGALILAAGASSRMGRPKQLLVWDGEPLVRRMARIALEVNCSPVGVVTGAHAEQASLALEGLNVQQFFFAGWQEGMGASLRSGLAAMLQLRPGLPALLVLMADQPLVDVVYLEQLISQFHRSGKPVAVSAYAGTTGPPVIFSKEMFPDLLILQGDQGAKQLLLRHPGRCIDVSFPAGAYDLDTPEDWEKRNLM